MKLKILTLNLHKGFSLLGQKYILSEIRLALREINPDLVFLQEALGSRHSLVPTHHEGYWASQYEYLADQVWSDFAYAHNAQIGDDHHGNAILSRFPIEHWTNTDLTNYRLEKRGMLNCRILLGEKRRLHGFCLHLGLMGFHRRRQYKIIINHLESLKLPDNDLMIIAGDFNDWNECAEKSLAEPLGFKEAYKSIHGSLAKSFPSFMPLLKLDRVYVKNIKVSSAHLLSGNPWKRLSDHLPLLIEAEI